MIIIDNDRCIGCGLCVRDCLPNALILSEGRPQEGEGCFYCGHCVAVCPQDAVRLEGNNISYEGMESAGEGFGVAPEAMLHTVKMRRSIRQFTKDPVGEEKIRAIIEAGRISPTASNTQNVSYIVVGSGKIYEFSSLCAEELREMYKNGSAEYVFPKAIYKDRIKPESDDFLFKGGRSLIITVSPHAVNASIASANMELMAVSEGLGVLYVGIFIRLLEHSEKLRSYLGMSADDTAVTCLSIGYPAVEYRRSAPKKTANVRWI